jgi:uncharacterized membrane protein YkoI
MKRWNWLFAAGLAMAAVPMAATANADEKNENETPVSLDKVPAPVRDTLLRQAAGAPIIDVVQETESGQAVYEAHIRKDNQVIGIEVDPSGKWLRNEVEGEHKGAPHK